MPNETFQPISVKPPSTNPLVFRIRCLVDLQLGTIVKYLRPAMANLSGQILDVGAGNSPWKEWLPKHCAYQGVDVENSDQFGMAGCRNSDVIYYDGKNMPFPSASFDGVICIEVLEHAESPDQLLLEISRIMKPGATLLLTVPWSARCHHRPYDYHRFTREQLNILLSRNGFSDVQIQERGSDISVIANKLVVVTFRLLNPSRFGDAIWAVPIGAVVAGVTALALISAHISDWLGKGSKDDPLGYFVFSRRSGLRSATHR